jgi:hypothetical protein
VFLGFAGVLWEYQGEAPWVFLTMPVEEAGMIKEMVPNKSGFGSIRVEVTLGDTTWKTSVFPDKDSGSYVLPVKRAVREAEGVEPGDSVEVELVALDS